MKRRLKQLVLPLFIAFLFLQFAFLWFVAEPYPAVVFPGFGDVPDKGGTIQFSEGQLWAYNVQGDSVRVDINKDFPAIPSTYQTMMMRELTQYVKDSHSKKMSVKLGNYRFATSISREVGKDKIEEFARWVAANAGWQYQDLKAVGVHWYDQSLSLEDSKREVKLRKYLII